MRITLPTRIPVTKAFLFSSFLLLVEFMEGTDPAYAMLVFAFFMLSVFAFNVAGGFSRPSGAYIFFYSTLGAGVGTVYKGVLGQPANTNLAAPVATIGVYAATAGALLMAAFITRKIVNTKDGMAGVFKVPQMNLELSALGCFVMVLLINNGTVLFSAGAGTILHALSMVNYFLPLGILLGTISNVRRTQGRHSLSTMTLCAIGYATFIGLLSFSKQGMFSPFVCYVLGLAWARFSLRPRHLIAIICFCFVAQTFMTPLSNVGRVEATSGSPQERLNITSYYLEHPFKLHKINKERLAAYAGAENWYFGSPQGIFDRLTMLPPDSDLIAFTVEGHYFGYSPIFIYMQNWVPHILNPHKLEGVVVGGNRYAHEMGRLAEEDTTTGISFSPSGEAFHLGGWTCVLAVQPLIFIMLFVTTDFVCGDLRAQPWGLLPMLLFAHLAPEQLLGGTINYVWMGNVGTIFAIFVSGYITPVFGKLLRGREGAAVWRNNLPAMVTAQAR